MNASGSGKCRRHDMLSAALVLAMTAPALAARPATVDFDVAGAVECSDATPQEYAATHPDERIIVARLQVTLRMEQGEASQLEEVLIDVRSPEQRLRVVDFEPRTQLVSELEGCIDVTRTTEKLHSLNAGLGGGVGIPTGAVDLKISPNGNIGTTRRDVVTETIRRAPPKQAVVVSGTTDAGHGVFFKLKPFPQGSLEGSRELVVKFVVPREWRGDWVRLRCRATTEHTKYYFVKSVETCGADTLRVGLYLAGDAEARQAALDLAASQTLAKPLADRPGKSQSASPLTALVSASPLTGLLPTSKHKQPKPQAIASSRRTVQEACSRLEELSGQIGM